VPDDLGDHDGYTLADLPLPDASDDVLAVLCDSGHANPPHRATCRVCSTALHSEARPVARPALGKIVTSAGETVPLTGPVVVGRDPRAARFQGTEIPRTVILPAGHISANHLEIRLEGWNVLAVDLSSRNGSFLRRHGQPPVRLPETPQLLVSGDVVDLGHGVQLTFEELP